MIKRLQRSEERGEKLQGEQEAWLRCVVDQHPILRELPDHVKKELAVEPGSWSGLPVNRHRRKRLKTGFLVHLYAGEREGFTLEKAMKEKGLGKHLLEVDIKRGAEHDMLGDSNTYKALLGAALQGAVWGVVGGPYCRSQSVLRRDPGGPRPVRSWDGVADDLHRPHRGLDAEGPGHQSEAGLWVGAACGPGRHARDRVLVANARMDLAPIDDGLGGTDLPPRRLCAETSRGGCEAYSLGGELAHRDAGSEESAGEEPRRLRSWRLSSAGSMAADDDASHCGGDQHPSLRGRHSVGFEGVDLQFRRDCRVCQEAAAKSRPHRRIPHPLAATLSVDTAGPFRLAKEGKVVKKFILVGAFTWLQPEGGEPDPRRRTFRSLNFLQKQKRKRRMSQEDQLRLRTKVAA